jgi:hypothetical protein
MPHCDGRAVVAPPLSNGVRHRRLEAIARVVTSQHIQAMPCSKLERTSDTVSSTRHGQWQTQNSPSQFLQYAIRYNPMHNMVYKLKFAKKFVYKYIK